MYNKMSCSVTERVADARTGPGGGPPPAATAAATSSTAPATSCRLRGSSNASLATAAPNSHTQNGPQPGQGANLRAKPCCLCWCCCCSCSCSTPGKGNEENGPARNSNNSDLLNYDGDPPPTLDEIRSWGRSFDRLMRSPAGRKVFRDFLRCEYSEENILFWLACEELKKENNPEVVEEKARIIYEDYISILSPKEEMEDELIGTYKNVISINHANRFLTRKHVYVMRRLRQNSLQTSIIIYENHFALLSVLSVSLDSRVREIVNRNMVEPTPHTFDEAQLQIYTLMHRDSYPRFVNSQLYRSLAQQQPQPSQDEKEELAVEPSGH